MPDILRSALFVVAGILLVGCDSSAEQAQSRETAAKTYQEGVSALESGDHASAVELLTAAVESGWLSYDAASAFTYLAIAQAAQGNYDEAHASLDKAEGGEGATADTFAARSYVFEEQGKKKEAKAMWNRARRLDRHVQKIGE